MKDSILRIIDVLDQIDTSAKLGRIVLDRTARHHKRTAAEVDTAAPLCACVSFDLPAAHGKCTLERIDADPVG